MSTASPVVVHLDAASVEAVARRIAELLGRDARLLDAKVVARRLGRSRAWVYDHADELGAVRLSDGKRPRLGFEVAKVAEYLDACETGRRTTEPAKPMGKGRTGGGRSELIGQGLDLLPIRGEAPPA